MALPIENQVWSERGTDKDLLKASRSEFQGDVLPDEVWETELEDGLSFATQFPPELSSYFTNRKIHFRAYDSYGNIAEVEQADGSITWGYGNSLPIAKVQNRVVRAAAQAKKREQRRQHERCPGNQANSRPRASTSRR